MDFHCTFITGILFGFIYPCISGTEESIWSLVILQRTVYEIYHYHYYYYYYHYP